MSNSEKSPTPLQRLVKEAAYFDRQADDCQEKANEWRTLGDSHEAEANNYRKQARETRAAIKTLEDAAKPGKIMPLSYEDLIAGHYHAYPFKPVFADESFWSKKPWTFDYAKPAPKYDFKVGDRVKHKDAAYGCGIVSEACVGNDANIAKVRLDRDPNNVYFLSPGNLTKIT